MKIAIVKKQGKSQSLNETVERFKQLLDENKIEYTCLPTDEKIDYLAVFGGDGTVLSNAHFAIERDIPIIAINAGTVGFLSSFEASQIETAVKLLASDSLTVKQKTALCVKDSDGDCYFALNDAVIERDKFVDGFSAIAKLSFSIDGTGVYDLSADGIIISTPTGSTAYSLSAGGVVLAPELKSFIATPICSHSLYTRPIVYSDEQTVKISVRKNSCYCSLTVDGRFVKRLKQNDFVTISKSDKVLKIVDYEEDFFDRLIKKLGK